MIHVKYDKKLDYLTKVLQMEAFSKLCEAFEIKKVKIPGGNTFNWVDLEKSTTYHKLIMGYLLDTIPNNNVENKVFWKVHPVGNICAVEYGGRVERLHKLFDESKLCLI